MHLLEILFLLFKEQVSLKLECAHTLLHALYVINTHMSSQSPTVLANSGTRRSELEKKRDLE